MKETRPLKLFAGDAEDLAVVAAVAQDALVPISEIAFLPADQRFVLVLNRFRWDGFDGVGAPSPRAAREGSARDAPFLDSADQPPYERTLAGLRFEKVTAVGTRGIDLRNRDRILELLTIHAEGDSILLVFAGNATIRLGIGEIRCFLEDFGSSWPTRHLPSHPDANPEKMS
jgi:hypothetical protein